MNIRIQIIVAIIVLSALIVIINMIRKKRLELRYALAWILVGVGILILDCFPKLINWLSVQLGIASPVNMLFFMGFCFSLFIIFGMTVTISKMSVQIKQLAQEIAFLEKNNKDFIWVKKDEK